MSLRLKSLSVTIQMKPTEQYFPVVLFIMLYNVVLSFECVDETLKCNIQMKATVEPRFNKVPRDWGKWFVISRFFSIHYTITGLKDIICCIEDFVL